MTDDRLLLLILGGITIMLATAVTALALASLPVPKAIELSLATALGSLVTLARPPHGKS